MTKQEFLELYGKSVYQVRLEMASHLWCQEGRAEGFDGCLDLTDAFVDGLLKENVGGLYD